MKSPKIIDLNADLGEGFGDDLALLEIVTSVNVACGGHAGDEDSMRRICEAAVARGVAIGAHPSYPDQAGFGRQRVALEPSALFESLAQQVARLVEIAEQAGGQVTYVKPHGALYHQASIDRIAAEVLCDATGSTDPRLTLLGPPGAKFIGVAKQWRLPSVVEAFIDRAYAPIGPGRSSKQPALVPRDQPGALLGPDAALNQALDLATEGIVFDTDQRTWVIEPRSLCIHSDTPGALTLARSVRAAIETSGVRLESFV